MKVFVLSFSIFLTLSSSVFAAGVQFDCNTESLANGVPSTQAVKATSTYQVTDENLTKNSAGIYKTLMLLPEASSYWLIFRKNKQQNIEVELRRSDKDGVALIQVDATNGVELVDRTDSKSNTGGYNYIKCTRSDLK